eukprot:scaffold20245_cov57-Phaeocystis_antarctica.AAC.2
MASSFGDASPGAKPSPGAYTPESLPSSDPPASASPEQCKVIEENRSSRSEQMHTNGAGRATRLCKPPMHPLGPRAVGPLRLGSNSIATPGGAD